MAHSQMNYPRWIAAEELGLPDLLGALVDGRWIVTNSTDQMDIEDPATGLTIATTIASDDEVIEMAVTSADRAFRTGWGKIAPVERARVLYQIAATIRSEREILARAESVDTGKPLSQARNDVDISARYFEFYAGVADKIGGDTIPQPPGFFAYTIREPYGVIAHITPWNSPLAQMSRGVAPSLAAGNTVVVKPSELTPISSLYAALLFIRAGLPEGVCNVVTGYGSGAGAGLVRHRLVRHVSFTGSVSTGSTVMGMAAERIIPCNLELGGKSPTIVLADADLEAAVVAGASAVIRNSGQSCFATTRLLVHRSLYEAMAEKVAKRMRTLSVGHGLNDPDLGPLISAKQHAQVKSYLNLARNEGAEVIQSAVEMPGGKGYFEMPALLTGVTNNMRVAREEIFGPVQSMIPFDDEEEAVAIANDSDYGLAAGLFTRDLSAAHRIAAQLEAGQVQINRYPIGGVETPFGGYKQSGIGREKGLEALKYYTQLKTVVIAL